MPSFRPSSTCLRRLPLRLPKHGDLSQKKVLDESPDSILQTLANDAVVDQIPAVKDAMFDVPASDLSATVEQASEPGPSPFQVPGTMPGAPVIPAPANTMDNDDDANLASVADPLHDKTVLANSGEQSPEDPPDSGPIRDTMLGPNALRRSPRGHNSKQLTKKQAGRKSQRSGGTGDSKGLCGLVDLCAPLATKGSRALIMARGLAGHRRRGYSFGGKAPRVQIKMHRLSENLRSNARGLHE